MAAKRTELNQIGLWDSESLQCRRWGPRMESSPPNPLTHQLLAELLGQLKSENGLGSARKEEMNPGRNPCVTAPTQKDEKAIRGSSQVRFGRIGSGFPAGRSIRRGRAEEENNGKPRKPDSAPGPPDTMRLGVPRVSAGSSPPWPPPPPTPASLKPTPYGRAEAVKLKPPWGNPPAKH